MSWRREMEIVDCDPEGWRDAPVWTPDTIRDATADWFKYLGRAAPSA